MSLMVTNHEYNTRSKDTINADQPGLVSALSKVESNLMQNITNLKDEVINLNEIIIKNQNKRLKTKVNVLENKIIDLEIQNNNLDQYSRRNNVEISGISQSVRDSHLEEKVVDILKAIDANVTTNEIDACHRLGNKNKNVIFRAINRKHHLKALRNKKKLKSIDKNAIGTPNANLFICENLTPANSKLAFNRRKLKRDGKIEKYYTVNGIVHIVKNNKLMKLYHLKDLHKLFPEYVFDNSDHAE